MNNLDDVNEFIDNLKMGANGKITLISFIANLIDNSVSKTELSEIYQLGIMTGKVSSQGFETPTETISETLTNNVNSYWDNVFGRQIVFNRKDANDRLDAIQDFCDERDSFDDEDNLKKLKSFFNEKRYYHNEIELTYIVGFVNGAGIGEICQQDFLKKFNDLTLNFDEKKYIQK